MFAGSFQGITQTAPLAIFAEFSTDFPAALALSAVLVAVSAAILLLGEAARPRRRCSARRRRERRRRSGAADRVGAARVRARRSSSRSAPGACLALVGPSGAGKSTVLRAIAGLHRPDAGRVTLGDEVWLDVDAGIDLPPERRSCGFVFQEYALFPHLSAWRNVAFGLAGVPRAERDARARARARGLGVEALADAPPAELSGGERQRVALARALAREPAVSCCSTSRSPRSTRAPRRRPPRELAATLAAPRSRPCSSPTTSPRRRCSPTRSR